MSRTGLGVMVLAVVLALPLSSMAMTPEEAGLVAHAAQRGHVGAQVLLAGLYLRGDGGLAKDERLAAYWFEQAAEQGNTYAQQAIADCYEAGRGVPVDLRLAADWREKAANRGNVQAQIQLAKMYLEGRGVARDAARAAQWLERAAVAGNGEAQYLLARLYHSGDGVQRDRQLAGNWLAKAAEQGYQDAVELVHLMESVGWAIEELAHQGPVDPRDLARDGDPDAAYRLAMRYESGAYGVPRDEAQALYWFRRAAEGGSVPAMRALEDVYRRGLLGQKADAAQAEAWRARIRAAIGR